MTGGITSIPLPAYWSSKEPEKWKRGPLRTLTCTNPRCAANNVNYAAIFNEPPTKRPRRPFKTSSRSRSVSVTSNPSTPVQPETHSTKGYVGRCSACDAPLIPVTQPASSTTTLAPPTPLSVRAPTPGSYVARLERSYCITSYAPPRNGEVTPYFKKRSDFKNPHASAPPPSECGDYNSEELRSSSSSSLRGGVRPLNEGGENSAGGHARKLTSTYEQESTRDASTESGSPASLGPHFGHSNYEVAEILTNITGIAVTDTTGKVQDVVQGSPDSTLVNGVNVSTFRGNDVESESSASPAPSEKGLNLSNDVRPVSDRNRISSFYNVLYTPEDTSEKQELDQYIERRGAEAHALKLKSALEVAVLSAFVTILILACFPSFLSGLRYHVFGCCSCTCKTASGAGASTPSPHFGQLKWFERWVYRGAHSLLGCRSPRQAVGSTVLR